MRTRDAFYIRFIVALFLLSTAQSACTGETYAPIDESDSGSLDQVDAADAHAHDSTPFDARNTADASEHPPEDTLDDETPDTADPDTLSPHEEDGGVDAPDVPDTPPEDVSPQGRWQSYFNKPTTSPSSPRASARATSTAARPQPTITRPV